MNLFKRVFGGGDAALKQVVVVRADVKMGKGKLAAQVSHASVTAAEESPYKDSWMGQGQKKSVLKVGSQKELGEIFEKAKRAELPAVLISDAGRTQIPAGTVTCAGIGPAPEEEVDEITGHLKLL